MKGKLRRTGYTDAFLRKNGCALRSTIIMTENAFMTVDAWEKMKPYVIEGLRNINKYVSANPQWWMLEVFNIFNAHGPSHQENE
jgi:hypothetical protein